MTAREDCTRLCAEAVASCYFGQRAALATMHGKEVVIAAAFRDGLGLFVDTIRHIDTDALGTFTGEVPRVGTMRETAIAKARLGMEASSLPIGIASEGSYGPHPHIPFVPGGVELMVLVDDVLGIVVSEHLIVDAPAYDHTIAADAQELTPFLDRIGFPDHAVIVKPNQPEPGSHSIHKGLRSHQALAGAMAECSALSRDGLAFVQTDMRAHMSPTRMEAIGRLALRLCKRLSASCPACGVPGFGQVDVETGLPCEWCGGPSLMVRYQIYGCVACDHREKRPRVDGRSRADPGQCPECNP